LENTKNSAGIHEAHHQQYEKHHAVADAARYREKADKCDNQDYQQKGIDIFFATFDKVSFYQI
jgi:hypothetical protein